MPRYRIKEEKDGISIELTNVGTKQEALLAAFGECKDGRCTCKTDEYEKLATMKIEKTPDRIALRLEAKPGEEFDIADIEACLDYTTKKVGH